MKTKSLNVLIVFFLTSLVSCVQHNNTVPTTEAEVPDQNEEIVKTNEPHRYGGWYCPDNLNGFPAVDIENWKNVPVINNRLPSKEETQSEASLIFVDTEKYPNAKVLDITMPKLARFYNENTQREDLIIVIQALNIDNDSIVGFRYLDGGNGSARLKEVKLLSDNEIGMIPTTRFVSHDIEIKATQNTIWDILTNPENAETLHPYFDKDNTLKSDWRKTANVNYKYNNPGEQTADYAAKLFGCFYIQNDFSNYTEKFLLLEDQKTGITELKIVCGPFENDFETQKNILSNWGEKVKDLSEE